MIDLSKVGKKTGIKGVYSVTSFDPSQLAELRIPRREVQYADNAATPVKVTVFDPVKSVGASPRNPGVYYCASTDMFLSYPGFACIWPPANDPVTQIRPAGNETVIKEADPSTIPAAEVTDGVDG